MEGLAFAMIDTRKYKLRHIYSHPILADMFSQFLGSLLNPRVIYYM